MANDAPRTHDHAGPGDSVAVRGGRLILHEREQLSLRGLAGVADIGETEGGGEVRDLANDYRSMMLDRPEGDMYIVEIVLKEAIDRALTAEQANETYLKIIDGQKDTIFGCNRVYGDLQEENARLTAQVAGLREAWVAIQDLTKNYDDKVRALINGPMACNREQAEYMVDNAISAWKKRFTDPDPGEKYRERVEKMQRALTNIANTKQIDPNYENCAIDYEKVTLDKVRRYASQALAALEGGRE